MYTDKEFNLTVFILSLTHKMWKYRGNIVCFWGGGRDDSDQFWSLTGSI